MKKLFIFLFLMLIVSVLFAQLGGSYTKIQSDARYPQKVNGVLMIPGGLKIGTIVSGTNIFQIDSVNQYSTDQYRVYKGSSLMSPYLPLLFKVGGTASTTIGNSMLLLTNPSAITFPRFNANNTITPRTAAEMRADLNVPLLSDTVTGSTLVPLLADSNVVASPNGYTTPKALQVGLAAKANSSSPTFTGTANAQKLIQTSNTSTQVPSLGVELTDGTGWTSTDWTGDYATGFTHTTGNTTALTRTVTIGNTNRYLISWTVSGGTTGTFTVSLGGITLTGQSATGIFAPMTGASGALIFTPSSTFDKTISNISVKLISASNPIYTIKDSTATAAVEVRAPAPALYSTFIGLDAGKYNLPTTVGFNTALGSRAGAGITSGYNNTYIGARSGETNTTGTSNTFVGYKTGMGSTSAYENTVIGFNAGYGLTTAYGNTFVGKDAGAAATYGEANTFVGHSAGSNLTQGGYNTFLGISAGNRVTTTSENIFIGFRAGSYYTGPTNNETPSKSVFIGCNTYANGAGQTNQIVIGDAAVGNGSNTFTHGNSSITDHYFSGKLHLTSLNTAPASASATGVLGEIRVVADYIYVCVATNTWVRTALTTW